MNLRLRWLTPLFSLLLSVPMNADDSLRDSLKNATLLLSFHPDSIELRLAKASWNMQLEQWEYAKDEYDYILARQPHNLAALYFRAYANERLHRYHFARLDYEDVLTVVPGHFEARLGLALLNEKDKHFTAALNGLNLLVEQHPDSALAWGARAGVERERGMVEAALYDLTEALKRSPNNKEWLLARADLYLQTNCFNDARRDLEKLVALGVSKPSLSPFFRRLKQRKNRNLIK